MHRSQGVLAFHVVASLVWLATTTAVALEPGTVTLRGELSSSARIGSRMPKTEIGTAVPLALFDMNVAGLTSATTELVQLEAREKAMTMDGGVIAITSTAVQAARLVSKFTFLVLDKVADVYIEREKKNFEVTQKLLNDQMCNLLADDEFLKMSNKAQNMMEFPNKVMDAIRTVVSWVDRESGEMLENIRRGVDRLCQALLQGFKAVKSQSALSGESVGITTLVMGVHAATMGNCMKDSKPGTGGHQKQLLAEYVTTMREALAHLQELNKETHFWEKFKSALKDNPELADTFRELETAKRVAAGFVRKFQEGLRKTLAPLSEFTSEVFHVQRAVVTQVKQILKTSYEQISTEILGHTGKATIEHALHSAFQHATMVYGAVSLSYNSALLARDVFRGVVRIARKVTTFKLLKFMNTKKLRFLNFARCRQMAASLQMAIGRDDTRSPECPSKEMASRKTKTEETERIYKQYEIRMEKLGITPVGMKDITACDLLYTANPSCLLQCFVTPTQLRPNEKPLLCPVVLGWNKDKWKGAMSWETARTGFDEARGLQKQDPPEWIYDFRFYSDSCRKSESVLPDKREWKPQSLNNGQWCLFTTIQIASANDLPITSVSLKPDVTWTEEGDIHGNHWKGPVVRVGSYTDLSTMGEMDVRESLESIDPHTKYSYDELVERKAIFVGPDPRIEYTRNARMRMEAASYDPELSKPFCAATPPSGHGATSVGKGRVTTRWAPQHAWNLMACPKKKFEEHSSSIPCSTRRPTGAVWLYEREDLANKVMAECVHVDAYAEAVENGDEPTQSDLVLSNEERGVVVTKSRHNHGSMRLIMEIRADPSSGQMPDLYREGRVSQDRVASVLHQGGKEVILLSSGDSPATEGFVTLFDADKKVAQLKIGDTTYYLEKYYQHIASSYESIVFVGGASDRKFAVKRSKGPCFKPESPWDRTALSHKPSRHRWPPNSGMTSMRIEEWNNLNWPSSLRNADQYTYFQMHTAEKKTLLSGLDARNQPKTIARQTYLQLRGQELPSGNKLGRWRRWLAVHKATEDTVKEAESFCYTFVPVGRLHSDDLESEEPDDGDVTADPGRLHSDDLESEDQPNDGDVNADPGRLHSDDLESVDEPNDGDSVTADPGRLHSDDLESEEPDDGDVTADPGRFHSDDLKSEEPNDGDVTADRSAKRARVKEFDDDGTDGMMALMSLNESGDEPDETGGDHPQADKDEGAKVPNTGSSRHGMLFGSNDIVGEVSASFHVSKKPGTGIPILSMTAVDCKKGLEDTKKCIANNHICDLLNLGHALDRCERNWVLNLDGRDDDGDEYINKGTCAAFKPKNFSSSTQSLGEAFFGLYLPSSTAEDLLGEPAEDGQPGENSRLCPETIGSSVTKNSTKMCILVRYDSTMHLVDDTTGEPAGNSSFRNEVWKASGEVADEEARKAGRRMINWLRRKAGLGLGSL